MLSACGSAREKLIVLALIETGMTAMELSRLTSDNIDWQKGIISTAGTEATGPLSEQFRELLRQHFAAANTLGIGNRQIQRMVRAIGRKAGLSTEVTPDVLRRTHPWSSLASPSRSWNRGAILLEAAKAAIDIIIVADDDRRVVDVNRAASIALGLPHDEIVGRTIDEFFEEANNQSIPLAWAEFLAQGQQCATCRLRNSGQPVFEYRARANFVPGLHLAVLRPAGAIEDSG